jgi:hypothetical protein
VGKERKKERERERWREGYIEENKRYRESGK